MSNFTELSRVNLAPGDNATFLIRWRGRQEGPYSAEVIEKKLSANEIGLLHEILHDGRWITIRDFLVQQEMTLRVQGQAREEQERRDREEAERRSRERDEESRAALLVEERRRNDLLAAGLERQSNTFQVPAASQVKLRDHRGGLILTLAIIGLFVFGPLCLAAWSMGSGDLREMNAGTMDPSGRPATSSGRNIGALGTILWVVGFVLFFMH